MLKKNPAGGYIVATFDLNQSRSAVVDRVRQALIEKGWAFHSSESTFSSYVLTMLPPVPVLWREDDPVAHDRIEALVERIRTSPTPSVNQLAAHAAWTSTGHPRPGVRAATIQREVRDFAKRVFDLTVDVDDLEAVVRAKQKKIDALERSLEIQRERERYLEDRVGDLRAAEQINVEYRTLLLKMTRLAE